jgi:phosphomannomutase
VVIFELEGGHRAMLRPSGTEPKLKYYFYATAPVHARDGLEESKKQALEVLERMAEDLTRSSSC